MKTITVLATLLLASGCGAPFVTEDAATGPEANFEQLWHEFDRYYSFFTLKNIDWDSLYDVYRPQVTPDTSPAQLLTVFSSMLDHLKDGHVNIDTPFGQYAYTGWYADAPENFALSIVTGYLQQPRRTAHGFQYGRIQPGVGYLWIPTFAGKDLAVDFDHAMAAMAPLDALVLDIRDNGGGSDLNTKPIAGRLTDSTRVYRLVRYRNGPKHDDFDPLRADTFSPAGPHFGGRVVLLTNRRVFSAGEGFVLALRTIPQMTIVGDTTGGGSGNPIARELPNGWGYRIPRWIVYTPDMTSYEGVGLAPDTTVWITPEDQTNGRDTILETALALLGVGPAR